MKAPAAKILAEDFIKGFFDVFDAMLSRSFGQSCMPPEEIDEARAAAFLERFPVKLSAVLQQGLGHVTVLLSVEDISNFLGALTATAAPAELGEAELATLREVADPALGGGIARMMEHCDRSGVQLDGVNVDTHGAAGAGALMAAMGGRAIGVSFSFMGGEDLTGEGVLLLSNGMDALVPSALLDQRAMAGISQPSLSQDELNDILGGFPAGTSAASSSAAENRAMSRNAFGNGDNLDLVLDIRLLATARLGRVEMPIGDVLNLGPGSILEIAHLVDEPIELLINGKLIARGDVVVVDEKFGLRITEIVSQRERIESLR